MACLRLGKAGNKVWKKLTTGTKLLHKFIIHQSKKLVVIRKPRRVNRPHSLYRHHHQQRRKQLISLSPWHTNHKRKKKHQKFVAPPRQPPIYIDDLFSTNWASPISPPLPSSSRLTKRIAGKNQEMGDQEDINVDVSSAESTSASLCINDRAEIFIASFRAELNRSLKRW